MRRETVGSEATGPNSSGSARSIATSDRQSPPSATARARSSRILPESCTARGLRHGSRAAESAASRPVRRTVSTSSTPPACETNPLPPPDPRTSEGGSTVTSEASSSTTMLYRTTHPAIDKTSTVRGTKCGPLGPVNSCGLSQSHNDPAVCWARLLLSVKGVVYKACLVSSTTISAIETVPQPLNPATAYATWAHARAGR